MEKRYQIFISSTFTDLQEERQAILKSILEMGHIPAGMELFPASDDTAWQLIQEVINASDYYVIVIAGRYGSLDETGIGYTEKEYDYAVQTKKPVIALIVKNPDSLPREKTETAEQAWKKLEIFRNRIEKKHHCNYWISASDLKSQVLVSLMSEFRHHPAIGWVRADEVPDNATIKEILVLKSKIEELEKETLELRTNAPAGSEDLAQGEDEFKLNCDIELRESTQVYPYYETHEFSGRATTNWNDLFAFLAPSLINECKDYIFRENFKKFEIKLFYKIIQKKISELSKKTKTVEFKDLTPVRTEIDTTVVQFRALGLITESRKQRSVKDTGTYWTMAPYGDSQMVKLRAIRRNDSLNFDSQALVDDILSFDKNDEAEV